MVGKRVLKTSLLDSFIDLDEEKSDLSRVITTTNSLKYAIFNVLDTETTSAETQDVYNKDGVLIKPKARVIELAYARLSPEGNISGMTDRFYNPGIRIPPSSISVHGITDKDVADKGNIEDEIGIVRSELQDDIILAYNSNFDYQMLPFLADKKWMDVYKMATHVWHIGQKNEHDQPLTSFKQQEIRYWLGLDDKYDITGEAHRADSDIQVTSFIFQEIRKHYLEVLCKPDTLEDFENWVDSVPEYKTIPFGPRKVLINENTGQYGVSADELPTNYLAYLLSARNPMKESYDKFGVTEYLASAYAPKLAQEYRIKRDPNYESVLDDIKSLDQVKNSLSNDDKEKLSRSGNKSNKEKAKELEKKISENVLTLDEMLKTLSEEAMTEYDIEGAESDKPTVIENSVGYNINAGVRAHAKKTQARKQKEMSYRQKAGR